MEGPSDRDSWEMAKLVINGPLWDILCMRRVALFRDLPKGALQELEGRMQLVSVGAGQNILSEGGPVPGLYFVVSGLLLIGTKQLGVMDHFGAEAITSLVQTFGAGFPPEKAPTVTSTYDARTVESTTCLLLSVRELASDVPMLRTLAQAAVMIDECSDDDEAAAVSSPQGGNILGTRSSSLEDLQSRRNELLRKLEAAKLMAKKEELEKQVRSLAEPHSDARDKTTMRRSNSDDIRTGAYSGVSGIAKGKLPSDTMSRQATSNSGATMMRSHSDTEMEPMRRDHSQISLQEEKARLESLIHQMHDDSQEKDLPMLNIKSSLHPALNGVIPLPRPSIIAPNDNRRLDREYALQLARHRKMWGSVWETSHYFEHAVYKRNMPKRGIPVDTSGDGVVDSLAFDITGNGKVDLIVSDSHIQKVAVIKNAAMRRSPS